MTQEEKSLLLKDLCARLPHGVKLNFYSAATKENYTCTLLGIEPKDDKSIIAKVDSGAFMFRAEHIKPYLRSMLSMTEEECRELRWIIAVEPLWAMFDFFYSHHIDFRDLIPKGLALEAKEGMYKTE